MPCSKSWLWLHILLDSRTNHLSGCIIAEVVSHGSVPSPCELWWTEWHWKCFSLNSFVFPLFVSFQRCFTFFYNIPARPLHGAAKNHTFESFFHLKLYNLSSGSQGNVVGIMTGIEIGQSRIWILIGARDFCLLKNVQTGSKTHKTHSTVTDLLFLG